MKKRLYSIFIAVILTSMVMSTALAGTTLSFKIIAGQTQLAGIVDITPEDNGDLTLNFKLLKNWCMTDAAIHTGLTLEDIPQNNGGAIPGQFDTKLNFGGCVNTFGPVTIDPAGFKEDVYIAIHLNVFDRYGVQETAWVVKCGDIEGGQFPGSNWSAWLLFPAKAWVAP